MDGRTDRWGPPTGSPLPPQPEAGAMLRTMRLARGWRTLLPGPATAGGARADRWLLAITVVLVGLGIVMIYSAIAIRAQERFGDPTFFLKKQAIWAALGLLAMVWAVTWDLKRFQRATPMLFLVSLLLLLLVLVPGIGIKINGARRWLRLFGLSFQPAELAKLADSVEIARNEKTVKTQKAANLSRLRQDLQRLDGELKKAIAQLPEKKEIPELLSSISSKAQQSGLDVLLFRPRPESYQEFYAEVPVDITVKGNFHNTVNFFDDVGRMDRLVNIDNIGFKNPTVSGDSVVLETTSVATAFRFLDEAERKKVAEEKAKAAKTKK